MISNGEDGIMSMNILGIKWGFDRGWLKYVHINHPRNKYGYISMYHGIGVLFGRIIAAYKDGPCKA
jgi:hypothetical protein